MSKKWLPTVALGMSVAVIGCSVSEAPADGSPTAGTSSGGSLAGGNATGGTSGEAAGAGMNSGGTASGGVATAGAASGGTAGGNSGGADTAGATSGGADSGGAGATSGGADAAGATSGGADSGGAGAAGEGNAGAPGGDAVVASEGCTVAGGADTLTAGGASVGGGLPTSTRLSIMAGGMNRDYIVDIPADYDPSHPYRLIFSWHQAFGSANGNAVGQYPANNGPNFNAQNYAFFGLHREATAANEPVIFVAPQGIGDFPWDYDRDVVLFDEILAKVTANLCIDESRVFTTGFSFGAMMSHALSIGRSSKLRGAVTMAPANYNFTQPPKEADSIAYFGITGMSDGTCRWVNSDANMTGGKYCVLSHAESNGCNASQDFPTAAVGGRDHVCYDFEGCDEGYPVKVCTFDGNHTPSAVADGMSGGDDGLNAFVPPLAWEFISQL